MANPWDEYKKPAKAPWDEYKKQEPSTAEDFARGVAQGATMGFHDELTGAVGGVLDPGGMRDRLAESARGVEALRGEAAAQDPRQVVAQMRQEGFSDQEIAQQLNDLSRFQEKEVPSAYTYYRDKARGLQKEAEERSPIASGGGQLLGALGTGGLIGAKSIPALIAEGSVYGLGGSEGTAQEQLVDTALGGATAGVIGGLSKGAGKLFDRAKRYLSGAAERQAVKGLGATTAQTQKIYDEQRMGRALLDEDVVGPFKSADSMQKKALKMEQKLARDLDSAYESVGGQGIPQQEITQRLLERAEDLSGQTANRPVVKKILDFAEDIEKKKGTFKPKEVRAERRAIDKVTNFNSDAPTQQANQAIRDVLRQTEDAAFSAQGLGDDFIDLKRRFGDITDARRILDRTASREKAGTMTELIKQVGLGGMGGLGYQTNNPYLMTAAMTAAAARKVGHGGAARVLDKLSKTQVPNAAPAINRMILSQNPYSFD